MKPSNIRLATVADIDEIANLFVKATDQMHSLGIRQWHYNYPLATHIMKDISQQSCYVLVMNNAIAGTITIDQNQDVQYKKIHWHHMNKGVMVIHRLAVHPSYQGNGISKKLCLFAEDVVVKNNMCVIRLDAYSLNYVSNKLYESLGYRRAAGFCYFHGNVAPFYGYDKKIIHL